MLQSPGWLPEAANGRLGGLLGRKTPARWRRRDDLLGENQLAVARHAQPILIRIVKNDQFPPPPEKLGGGNAHRRRLRVPARPVGLCRPPPPAAKSILSHGP